MFHPKILAPLTFITLLIIPPLRFTLLINHRGAGASGCLIIEERPVRANLGAAGVVGAGGKATTAEAVMCAAAAAVSAAAVSAAAPAPAPAPAPPLSAAATSA